MRRVAALFLPLVLLIIIIVLIIYRSEAAKEMTLLRSQEILGVRMGSDALKYNLDDISKNLRYLAGNRALKRALDAPGKSDFDHLADDFANFLLAMGTFDKVRWIDETGKEKVRVNYSDGRAIIVAEEDLQDKEDRYYFAMTLKLKKGDIYISPLDLNMERGEVETPYKPVIRFSMPVFNSAGTRRGMLILNYLAERALGDFSRASRGIGGHVMILNAEGFWVKSQVPEDEWGFMFNRKENMQLRYPEIWPRIRSGETGQFEQNGDLWTFNTVYPIRAGNMLKEGAEGPPPVPSRSQTERDEYVWKVVSYLPEGSIALNNSQRTQRMAIISVLLAGVLFFVCWKAASAWTRQKAAEEEEKRMGARLSLLMQSMGEGVFGIDAQGRCVFINPAALSILGLTKQEVFGKNTHSLFHQLRDCAQKSGEDECPILQTMKNESAWQGEDEFIRKDGTRVPVLISATPLRQNDAVVGTVVVFQDISERKQIAEKLRQSQKMEAVGTLAGGVAHDFNNILTTIMGHAHLLRMSVSDNDPIAVDVSQIIASGERAKTITQRLMAFSRKQVMLPARIDLESLVSSFEPLMQRLLTKYIDIRIRASGETLTVMADRMQLEQVLMNIVENAGDSMPYGGTLTISTGVVQSSSAFFQVHNDAANKRYAFVAIADTGGGMDEQTRQRAFEPFFTTKEPDKGPGLGLAVVYGIVQQLKGYVDVESEKGRGTTVTVYLPLLPTSG